MIRTNPISSKETLHYKNIIYQGNIDDGQAEEGWTNKRRSVQSIDQSLAALYLSVIPLQSQISSESKQHRWKV